MSSRLFGLYPFVCSKIRTAGSAFMKLGASKKDGGLQLLKQRVRQEYVWMYRSALRQEEELSMSKSFHVAVDKVG